MLATEPEATEKNVSTIKHAPARQSPSPSVATLANFGWKKFGNSNAGETYIHHLLDDKVLLVPINRPFLLGQTLPTEIPGKGQFITALIHFWLTGSDRLERFTNYLARHTDRPVSYPKADSLLVLKVKPSSYHITIRQDLDDGVWTEYIQNSKPSDLGWDLPFCPTLTALDTLTGEQLNLSNYIRDNHYLGQLAACELTNAYEKAYRFALKRRIVILETTFTFGYPCRLAGSIVTPDSSFFTNTDELLLALEEGRQPRSCIDESLRRCCQEGEIVGQRLNSAVNATAINYQRFFRRLTGHTLQKYQSLLCSQVT